MPSPLLISRRPCRPVRFRLGPSSSGLFQVICLLVLGVFSCRAAAGQMLPDLLAAADSACECQIESPTEELEADDQTAAVMLGSALASDICSDAVSVCPLRDTLRTPTARLSLRPPLLRGPPA